jgi:hypothetical protein
MANGSDMLDRRRLDDHRGGDLDWIAILGSAVQLSSSTHLFGRL